MNAHELSALRTQNVYIYIIYPAMVKCTCLLCDGCCLNKYIYICKFQLFKTIFLLIIFMENTKCFERVLCVFGNIYPVWAIYAYEEGRHKLHCISRLCLCLVEVYPPFTPIFTNCMFTYILIGIVTVFEKYELHRHVYAYLFHVVRNYYIFKQHWNVTDRRFVL